MNIKKYLLLFLLVCSARADITLPSGAVIEESSWTNRPSSSAMLIVPGGGYLGVTKSEGLTDLGWLTTNGVRCYTIIYRIAPYPSAFDDVMSAWDCIHTNTLYSKFGIMGASAGGHLSALTVGKTKYKPDVAVFIYPLVTMRQPGLMNFQCLKNMAGGLPITQTLMDEASAEGFIDTSKMPPSFIAHNLNDTVVHFRNTTTLMNMNPQGELHLFNVEPAEHGMSNPPPWLDNCIRFLKVKKFIQP